MRNAAKSILLLATTFLAATVHAQGPANADLAKRIKSATGMVENGKRGQGSAFCVHDSGLFITNEHVVRGAEQVRLILHPGLANQEIVTAKVIRTDEHLDLALLKVDDLVEFTPLTLGSSEGLAELTNVIAAGFPFGTGLAQKKGEYPAVSINQGKISSLRMKDGELHRIQMDAVVNPGNSGGPVLDSKGKVVGVVVSGVIGATVNFAIPVSHVHRFVATPEVELVLPAVKYEDRFQPAQFQAKAVAPVPSKEPYQVELILRPRDGGERTFKMTHQNGVYQTQAQAMLKPSGPKMLKVTLSYPEGKLQGRVCDCTFKLGDQDVKLSEVQLLQFNPDPSAVLLDKVLVKGALKQLDELVLILGTDTVKLNPGKALAVEIHTAPNIDRVEFSIVVRQQGKELTRLRDALVFVGAPPVEEQPLIDVIKEAKNLDGFWVLEHAETAGQIAWPILRDEAIYIEGNKITWVSKKGKILADGAEANISIDPLKTPRIIDLTFTNLRANKRTWLAIYKLEGERLIIATNCDGDQRPSQFTTRIAEGRAMFVRTYRRSKD